MIGRPRRPRPPRTQAPPMDDNTIEMPVRQTAPRRVGYHAPPWTPVSDQLLSDWMYGMRRAMKMANEASERWNERSNWLNAYADKHGMDLASRAIYRSKDLWLEDHFGTWSFFEREVRRYGDMIAAEHRMRQMMSIVEAE